MKKIFYITLLILGMASLCHAQNFVYDYQMVRLDSTLDNAINPKLQKFVDKQKSTLAKEMNRVIGHCDETLQGFDPASPLSNFLTDMMLTQAPLYSSDTSIQRCDMAILNFGGIRTNLAAGDITVGDVFRISPFNNRLVFIEIHGSELRKMINRFTEHHCKEAFAGAQITFRSGRPSRISIQGEPININKTYRLVTLDYIAGGGDNIMTDIKFLNIIGTETIYRDFIINEISKMTAAGQSIKGKMDERVIILPTP